VIKEISQEDSIVWLCLIINPENTLVGKRRKSIYLKIELEINALKPPKGTNFE